MDTTPLHCLLADSSFAACYDHASLNAADSQRLAATPQLAQRQDWQVSRALKQQTDLPAVSLSHSQGKSVGYVFDSGQPVGLRAGKQTDWRGTSAILADTMAIACVWKEKTVALQWQFFGSLKLNDLTDRQTI